LNQRGVFLFPLRKNDQSPLLTTEKIKQGKMLSGFEFLNHQNLEEMKKDNARLLRDGLAP